jgi:radical SAM superfamily enzyme YgiQ (UPF0313 family)
MLTIRRAGATRISINPQTMNDKTLAAIGRRHNAHEIVEAFALARELGFGNINADIIAALPGENLSDFEYTLSRMDELRPQSLTVHTLASSAPPCSEAKVMCRRTRPPRRRWLAGLCLRKTGRLRTLLPLQAEVYGGQP